MAEARVDPLNKEPIAVLEVTATPEVHLHLVSLELDDSVLRVRLHGVSEARLEGVFDVVGVRVTHDASDEEETCAKRQSRHVA